MSHGRRGSSPRSTAAILFKAQCVLPPRFEFGLAKSRRSDPCNEKFSIFAIVGASGNVGYPVTCVLRKVGVPVRAILRDVTKAARLETIGCEIALADVQDVKALAQTIGDVAVVQVEFHCDRRRKTQGGICAD